MMRVNILAAVAMNDVIGRDGELPWHPADVGYDTYFSACLARGPIIMGSRTWRAIDHQPVPGRTFIVLSSRMKSTPYPNVLVASSLDTALALAATAYARPPPSVWVVGGAAVYKQALPLADGLYLTRVHAAPQQGDAFFPPIRDSEWQLVAEQTVPELSSLVDERLGYCHFVYRRRIVQLT